jgi:cysteine synthase
MKALNIEQMVGNTPVVEIDLNLGKKINTFIKLEGYNPTGSIKDRTALFIIKEKLRSGELTSGKIILDASSGSFACSMAYFGKIFGFPVLTVTGSKMTEDKLKFVKYFGANNISIDAKFTIEGNRYCKDVLIAEKPNYYCFLDQLHNWENPNAHYQTTGSEILRDFPNISAVAFSIGSGGTLCGVSKYLKEHNPKTKIIAVTANKGTKIPGTAAFLDGEYETPFIKDFINDNRIDYTAVINEEMAIKNVIELRSKGLYVGIQTGGVIQGIKDAIKELDLTGDILLISGDSGWKNSEKLSQLI